MSSTVGIAWDRIVAWLKAHAPADALEPFPAPAPEAVERVRADLGRPLPPELLEFHARLHEAGSSSALPADDDRMAMTPLTLEEILAERKMRIDLTERGQFADLTPRSDEGVAAVWWHPDWIPFAGNGGGDLLGLDLAPTPSGRAGQVITHAHETGRHRLLGPSLAAYLQALAERVEAGEFVFDAIYGLTAAPPAEPEPVRDDDLFTGMTEWHFGHASEQGEAAFKAKDYALYVAHLARFEARLDKLQATRLAFARKKIGESK